MSISAAILGPVLPLSGTSSAGAPGALPKKDTAEKIQDAAKQFEALMIGQILKAAQPDDGEGWSLGGEEDEASSTAMGFANDYFARALSAKGGLGLSKMITKSLELHSANSSSPVSQAPAPAGTHPGRD
jgi:Rod binding domain-containing protein